MVISVMGNSCGGINLDCSCCDECWDKFKSFFGEIGDFFKDFWKDAQWIYYISKDVLLLAGPFIAFFAFVMLTRAETVIQL